MSTVIMKSETLTVLVNQDVENAERETNRQAHDAVRNDSKLIEAQAFPSPAAFEQNGITHTESEAHGGPKKPKPVMGKDIFVSYSRQNKETVFNLVQHLESISDKTFWFDVDDIPPAAAWWDEIVTGIREAQNCLFFVSNAWLQSPVCQRELECAVANGKSIIPVIIENISYPQTPEAIAKLNWIFLRQDAEYEVGFGNLVAAITVNLDLVRRHTKLLQMTTAWIASGLRSDHLLREKALEEAKDVLIDCSVGKGSPTIVPDQAQYVRESERYWKRRRRIIAAIFFAFCALLLVALAVAVLFAILAEIAKRDTQVAYGIANVQKVRAEIAARENLFQSFGARAAGYIYDKRTTVGLLFGAEAMRVMQNESIPNLHSTLQAHRKAMDSLGADWVYEGPVAYDVIPVISNNGNTVAFLANSSTVVLVTGLSSHVFRTQYVRLGSDCAPLSQYRRGADQYIVEHNFFRLSLDGTVLLLSINRAGDITRQDDAALCVADLRHSQSYGTVHDAVRVPIGPFSDVYYGDSGVIVVSVTVNSTTHLLVWSSVDELLLAPNPSAARRMLLEAPVVSFHSLWGATFLDCIVPDSDDPHFLVVIENSMWPDDNQPNRARIHAFKPLTDMPTQWPKSTRPVEIDAPFTDRYSYFTDVDAIWFVKQHDSTCTWITNAYGHFNLNAPALFDEVPPLLANSTTSITLRHEEQPFTDSSGQECEPAYLVIAYPIDSAGHAIGLCNNEMLILDYTDNFAVSQYIPNYVLFTPFAVAGPETVAIVRSNADLFWSPTGLGQSFFDGARFGSFHLPSPQYLIPNIKGTNLYSFADDGMAVWTPSYSVSSRSPAVTSYFPCNTDFQLPFLSHNSVWTTYLCVTIGYSEEEYQTYFSYGEALLVNQRATNEPIALEKLYGSEQLFEWVEFETTRSLWLAVWSFHADDMDNLEEDTVFTLIVDIYNLQGTAPTLAQRLQKVTNSRIMIKGDRLVCGNWLLFQDCLVHVRDDGSVSSNCSVDLSRLLKKEASCTEDCIAGAVARVQFTNQCDRLLIVSWPCPCVNNPTLAAVISLSDNGTVSEPYVVTQQGDIETSVLMLSVLPSFTFAHGSDCNYTYYVLSPNGQFLGTVCSQLSESGINLVMRLFNLSSSFSSSAPIWTLATEGPLSYEETSSFLLEPPLLSFSPNSQYMAFQKRHELAVFDLTRLNFTSDPLVLSTKLASIDQTINARTRILSYPLFSVDSMYLCSLEYYGNLYSALEAPVYPVHPQAHTASLCKVAGRDLTAAEWQEIGLGQRDHPICPGPIYDGATCFGVPLGQHIFVGSPIASLDTCLLDSYSFALQFTFTAELYRSHEVKVGSEYSTDIGVYDEACKTLGYSQSAASLTVPLLSRGQKAHIIVSSSRGDQCGRLTLQILAL